MNNISKMTVDAVIKKMKGSNAPVEAIIRALLKLKCAKQADIARATRLTRASVSCFVLGKSTSKKLNSYFKNTFYIDVNAMYAAERLGKELNLNLMDGVQ